MSLALSRLNSGGYSLKKKLLKMKKAIRKSLKKLFKRLGFRVRRISNVPSKRADKASDSARLKPAAESPDIKLSPPATKLSDCKQPKSPFVEMKDLCQAVSAPIIFDVGAHHGETCRRLRSVFPDAVVYAFEPFAASFEILKANTADDPNIKVFNFGFSDSEGVCAFHSNAKTFTNSLLSTDERGADTWGRNLLETQEVVEARFTTLDAFIQMMNLTHVDILKLDAQGAEYMIMEGARESCSAGKLGLVFTEIITQPTYKNQKRLDEALNQFERLGFELHNLYNLSVTDKGKLRQVDAIFTKRGA